MKRADDKRMYLVEFDSKHRLPSVTPVWGQRSKFGLVTFTRFRRDDRLWAEPTTIFETELGAWQFIEKLVRKQLVTARAQIQRVRRVMPTVRRHIARLTKPKKKKKGA